MNINDKYYIGSTKDIKYRIARHKSRCYNQNYKEYNIKVYKYIRDNCNDWSKVSFQILDVYDDISKKFKREIEQYYIDYFSNNLNMIRAKYDKEKTKEKSNKKKREKYRNDEQYRNNYKKEINEHLKLKYRNDEQYRNNCKKKHNEKVICECGRIVSYGNIGAHRKSKIHQNLLNK